MSRTGVSISESASVALVDPNGTDKTIILPTAATGKFIYVADATGKAQANPIWISTNGTGLSIVGAILGPGGMPVINRNYGAIGLLANGNNW